MSNQSTLLQYYVVRNWAREIINDIDSGAVGFRVRKNSHQAAVAMQNVREQQLRMIEILNDLVADNSGHSPDPIPHN